MLESTMLMISDDHALIESVGAVARSIDHLALTALPSVEAAYRHESWDDVSLVLVHLVSPGLSRDVARLLRMISAARRPVATLVVGEPPVDDQASSMLRMGAADYLARPVEVSWLAHLLEVLTVKARQPPQSSAAGAAGSTGPGPGPCDLGGGWPGAGRLVAQVRRVAPLQTTVLIGGEPGTGKGRLARLIHDLSPRRLEPFAAVDCSGVDARRIEGVLFGRADSTAEATGGGLDGQLARAGGGTLFLREVAALPPAAQSRLLRAIEDRAFEAAGSNEPRPFRARLIASSSRPLDPEVEAGRFRSDLHYRLNVVGFHLPPLRERPGTIPVLAARFVDEFAAREVGGVASIAEEALRALARCDWPGNIRELRAVIERSAALCPGREIRARDLPDSVRAAGDAADGVDEPGRVPAPPGPSPDPTLAEIKRDAEVARITEALAKHRNNRLRAASELGISRMTLYKKLYKYGLMHAAITS